MKKVKRLMDERGIRVTDLAIRSGVSDVVVSKVIRGVMDPYPKWRNAIARALDWTRDPMELFEEEETGEDK